ncbi:MAG: hypothetical protein GF416_01030 [Candidatus Altiarchaeales archaeon]|nr:hypothetical protein [Candidatus Altiarchaeales archaeon]MBD3415699.1 hypothetical protein [Candidatus Altiarchaeales archaeon]
MRECRPAYKIIIVLSVIAFSSSHACGDFMLSYTRDVHGVDKGGWTHKSYHHDFDCEGACDLASTPCYGKNWVAKTFSIPGPYTLIKSGYSCEKRGSRPCNEYGNFCAFWYNGAVSQNSLEIAGGDYDGVSFGESYTATLIKGPFELKYQCKQCEHGSIVISVSPSECDVDIFYKTFGSCTEFCNYLYGGNTYGKENGKYCFCYCKPGYWGNTESVYMGGLTHKRLGCTEMTTTTLKATTTTKRKTTTTLRRRTTTTTTSTTTTTFPTFDPTKDYCGPEGHRVIMKLIPDGNWFSDVDFRKACYNHDKCYAECETKGNRQIDCDNQLRRDMKLECKIAYNRWMNKIRKRSILNPLRAFDTIAHGLNLQICYGQAHAYEIAVMSSGDAIGAYPCKKGGNFDWLTG